MPATPVSSLQHLLRLLRMRGMLLYISRILLKTTDLLTLMRRIPPPRLGTPRVPLNILPGGPATGSQFPFPVWPFHSHPACFCFFSFSGLSLFNHRPMRAPVSNQYAQKSTRIYETEQSTEQLCCVARCSRQGHPQRVSLTGINIYESLLQGKS